MSIYYGNNKINPLYYGNNKIGRAYYGSTLVYESDIYKQVNYFYMNFNNTTGSSITVNSLSNLFTYKTGSPTKFTAVVERSNGTVENVASTSQKFGVLNFGIASGESCVFRTTWQNGIFCLMGSSSGTTHENIVTGGGLKLYGNYDIPQYFLAYTFKNSIKFTTITQTFDTTEWIPTSTTIPDGFMLGTFYGGMSTNYELFFNKMSLSNWYITSIGNDFMSSMFSGCTSLQRIRIPTTTNWAVTSIGNNFLSNTFYSCFNATTNTQFQTQNWAVTSIGNNFMYSTYYDCVVLSNLYLPNTSNWNVTSKGSNCLYMTYYVRMNYRDHDLFVQILGSLYLNPTTNSLGMRSTMISNVQVTSSLRDQFRNSSMWSEIPDDMFV